MTNSRLATTASLLIALCTSIAVGQEDSARSFEHNHWNWFRFHRSPTMSMVNFVLKNAFSYGFHELRKKNGSWPFESEAPISNDTFMIGVTMVF